jgi:hypothetical protein
MKRLSTSQSLGCRREALLRGGRLSLRGLGAQLATANDTLPKDIFGLSRTTDNKRACLSFEARWGMPQSLRT